MSERCHNINLASFLRITFRGAKRFCLLAFFSGLAACARHPYKGSERAASVPNAATTGATASIPKAGSASGERLGTVQVIGTGQRFVLIRTPTWQSGSTLVDGQALICRAGGNVTATLRVSRERRPPFVVADVASGEPHVGDDVLIDTAPGRATIPGPVVSPAATPAPDFQANPILPPTS